MAIKYTLDKGLAFLFNESPQQIFMRRFSEAINTGSYDDEVSYSILGSSFLSGLVFPMGGKKGSEEAMLIEQGKLLTKDKIVYIAGSYTWSGAMLFGLGSPTTSIDSYYALIPDGIKTYTADGSIVYSKLWLRHSIPGSLF